MVYPRSVLDDVNSVYVQSVVLSLSSKTSFILPVTVREGQIEVQTTALVDSGAYAVFANHRFVERHGLKKKALADKIHVYNADGTRNRSQYIDSYVMIELTIGDHSSRQAALVTDLGRKDLFLGMSYLKKHNPEINWRTGEWQFSRCPETCRFKELKTQAFLLGP